MNTNPLHAYVAASVLGAAGTAISVPLWRILCLKLGVVDDPGHRKLHAIPTPLAGGVAVFTGITVCIAAALIGSFANIDTPLCGRSTFELPAVLVGMTGILILGLLDDRFELKPAHKFAGQIIVAALVAVAGIRITLFVPSPVFSYSVTILWIVAVTNAFNFMDNMNGLCAGLGAIAAVYLGVNAHLAGQANTATLAFALCGGLLGFLPYNYPRATVFLGDSGSHLIGFLVAVLAVLPHFHTPEHPKPIAVAKPLAVLAVPLFDLVQVVLLRLHLRKPVYIGDTNHLSHHLVRAGLPPTRAVLLIWFFAAATGAVSLL